MTEEKQAVKTLAEELVRAMKSVSSKYGKGTSTTQIYSSGNAETIYASQIVGLPDALYLALNDIEEKSATDEMAAALLSMFHRISAIEVGNITADTAQIENLYATFGDFMHLVAESATIGSLDVNQLRADMAAIGLLTLSTADIQNAQIDHLSTDDAFIRYGVGGKLYIDDLAIGEANVVNLAVGTLLLNNQNGDLVRLYVDENGHPATEAVSYAGDSIINNNSLNGTRIIQNSITADRLNVSEIFAKDAMVMDLIADNINANRLFANEGIIPKLETTIITSQNIGNNLDISSNSAITMLNDRISITALATGKTFLQKNQPIPYTEGDVWFNPINEEHYVASGTLLTDNPQFAYDDDGNLKYYYPNHQELDIAIDNNDNLTLGDNVDGVDYFIDYGYLSATGMWKKVENVAFSNLTVAVDGIEAEVFDSETGSSKIAQNASSITSLVEKTEIDSLGQGETLYSKISQNASEISSIVSKTGINSLGQSETLYSKIQQSESGITSLVTKTGINELGDSETLYGKISLTADGVETLVSKTGINSLGQSETLYSKIGQTESSITSIVSKTGINSLGQSETLYSKIGQTENSISLIVNGTTAVGKVSTSGIDIQNNSLTVKSSGSINLNAGGKLNATAGTVNLTTNDITIGFNTSGSSDTASKVKINKTDGIKVYDSHGSYFQATGDRIGLYSSNGTARLTMDSDGNATFAGKMNASCITSGYISADRINTGTITIAKLTSDAQAGIVKNITTKNQYYLSTSNSSVAGGSWSDSIPTWASGKYIWTRVATTKTYANSTSETTYSTAVYDRNLTTALSTAGTAQSTANGAIKKTESIYYRSTKNTTPSTSNITIGTSDDTDNAWEYVMPKPKRSRYFFTCERYTYASNTVGYSTVRALSELNYTSMWCSANNATQIDGSSIYAGSITATQIDATNLHVKAANIDGTLTIGKLPNTVAQKTDNISQFTNDSGYQNSTQVTTITENTIKTTSVVATNLHVKAANIDDTLSAGKIKGGTLTLGGSNNTNGSAVIKNTSGSDIITLNNDGIVINSGKIKVNGGGEFNNITVKGNSTFAGTLNGATGTFGGNLIANTTQFKEIVCPTYMSHGSAIYQGGALKLNSEGILITSAEDQSFSPFCAIGSDFIWGCKHNKKVTEAIIGTLFEDEDTAKITKLNLSDSVYEDISSKVMKHGVLVSTVRNVSTNANGNVNLGLLATRYVVLAIRASGDSTLIATPYCYYNNTNNTWNWYAHVTPSTDTSTSWANKTGIYTVAYIDLGANGF